MTAALHRLLPCAVAAVALLGGLTACDDGSADNASEQPVTASTSDDPTSTDAALGADCSGVITSAVVEMLGWASDSPAVEDRGGCTWTGKEGNVAVVERAETYNDECERLVAAAPAGTFRSELGDGIQGCGYVRDESLGLSEWVIDVDDRVISVSVAAVTDTEPEQVQAALSGLTKTATNVS